MQIAIIDNKMVELDKLESPYLDRGLYFGDGVYEVVRSYNGKIFALNEHLNRFAKSLSAIRIDGVDIESIRIRVLKAFEAANILNARIYFHVTRGSALRSHIWDTDLKPNFFLTITELDLEKEKKAKAEGIAVATCSDLRWKRCDIKSLNLLPNVLARAEAADKGCSEAIFVDEDGYITEGAGSTFFAIIESKLQTAPLSANILPSITRSFVIKAAEGIGLDVVEESLIPAQAALADELFIAVTTQDIVPVIKLDDDLIIDGKPGKLTKKLIEQFHSFTI